MRLRKRENLKLILGPVDSSQLTKHHIGADASWFEGLRLEREKKFINPSCWFLREIQYIQTDKCGRGIVSRSSDISKHLYVSSSLLLQGELESQGLPPCEGAVNLAGENLMNPLRWWEINNQRVHPIIYSILMHLQGLPLFFALGSVLKVEWKLQKRLVLQSRWHN